MIPCSQTNSQDFWHLLELFQFSGLRVFLFWLVWASCENICCCWMSLYNTGNHLLLCLWFLAFLVVSRIWRLQEILYHPYPLINLILQMTFDWSLGPLYFWKKWCIEGKIIWMYLLCPHCCHMLAYCSSSLLLSLAGFGLLKAELEEGNNCW